MTTYLLTWNPQKWQWDNIKGQIEEIYDNGVSPDSWSCGMTNKIVEGDRVFLLRQGTEPRGICASGWSESAVSVKKHWNREKAKRGVTTRYIKVRWEVILDPDSESILPREWLNRGILKEMHWNTQISGIKIRDDIALALEEEWEAFLRNRGRDKFQEGMEYSSPDEIINPHEYHEGAIKRIAVNVYERNPEARTKCLKHYGYDCYICDFSFERVYGTIGKNFIHVHHLKPLSEIGAKYKVDPIRDLRPICPNCHAIVHKRNPPFSIEEMTEILEGKVKGK
jgi:5-methylcytosine-specific restriction protein A